MWAKYSIDNVAFIKINELIRLVYLQPKTRERSRLFQGKRLACNTLYAPVVNKSKTNIPFLHKYFAFSETDNATCTTRTVNSPVNS